ncbi:PadR family transcriptional regulator [candidate division KSB1 bacterium]|nr:PadR family transcriptional regulator [candidate division KSB1 bacterium]
MNELTRKEEQILLAVHALGDQASLLNIKEQIYRFTNNNYSVGTIYAPLNRLYLNGYLTSDLIRTPESKKPVKYYKLTRQGYQALAQLRKQTDEMWQDFVMPAFDK